MKIQGKRIIMGGIAVVLLIAGGVGIWWRLQQPPHPSAGLLAQIQSQSATQDAYALAQKGVQAIASNPGDVDGYVSAGNNYKSIGDLLHSQEATQLALYYYNAGIARLGTRSTVLINNAGNIYRDLGEYPKAESLYKKAIESNPGDPAGYIALLSLYQQQMKKPSEEILAVYKQALQTLVENARVVQMLAEYLVSIGKYQDALPYYQLLDKKYPGQFAQDLRTIEARVAASSSAR